MIDLKLLPSHSLSLKAFDRLHRELETKIHTECNVPDSSRPPWADGAIDTTLYYKAPVRIAWLLKETYDEPAPDKTVYLSYREFFESCDDVYDDFIGCHGSRKTWGPIAYASYSILTNLWPYNGLDWMHENKSIAEIVRSIAIVNVKKMPGTSKSNMNDIREAFSKNASVLKAQLELLQPHVIIGGNTLGLYREILQLAEPSGKTPYTGRLFYIQPRRLLIDAYHPARIGSPEHYVDDCISTVRDWLSSL